MKMGKLLSPDAFRAAGDRFVIGFFQMYMRNMVLAAGLLFSFLAGFMAAGAQEKPAYSVFTSEGRRSDYGKMLKALSSADIVFIGETHNCPVAHWLEFEITSDLWQKDSAGLVMGAEMFETDDQLLVDEYVSGLISSDRFETEAKLWDNYYTDYYPLLSFAREKGLKFIATNVPRRYASFVKDNGLEALESLSDEAKSLMAPLPIDFEASEEDEAMFGFMRMISGHDGDGKSHFAEAQALKDATMAWSISSGMDRRFIHYNGNYHSDFHGGIIPYLEKYLPGKTVMTVCCIRQDDISVLDEENRSRADFIICVPVDMTMTY